MSIDQNSNAENSQIETKELAPGVILTKSYQKISDETNYPDIVGLYIFKVQLTTMSVLDFEIFLDQSENIFIENQNQNTLHIKDSIKPFESKIIAKILLKENWKLKTKFKLSLGIPEKVLQDKYIENYELKINELLRQANQKLNLIPFAHMNINDINNILNSLNFNFIDTNFPPNDISMFNNIFPDIIKNSLDYVIHWRRPIEFIKNKKLFLFNNENNIFTEIKQGLIPLNHLDSCISSLSEKFNLITRLFSKNMKYNENGIYQIKLCNNGEWITVYIDDYIPCIPLSGPLVTSSQNNDLWILFLEKALAKLYGSYYNLISINISDFFLTLTGCPTIFSNIDENNDDFFNKLKEYIDKNYIVVAMSKINNDNQNQNLTISNFGYTILDVKNKYKPNLVVLRKIWYDEKTEKNIESYNNKLFNQYPSLINEINDNILLLTYEDFINEFQSIVVCFTKNWDEIRIRGKFININNENYSKIQSKWYYNINLERQTNLIISLFQDEEKINNNINPRKPLIDISLSILKQDFEKNEISHIQTYDYCLTSNIQVELNLPAGSYIIFPRTSGCLFGKNFINNNNNFNENIYYDLENKNFSIIFINAVKEIFKKFDILSKKILNFEEFYNFYSCVSKNNEMTEEKFSNLLEKYQSFNDGFTEQGFIDFFKKKFLSDGGEKEVKIWFKNLGYDDELYSLKSRCFMLNFHSDNAIKISVKDAIKTDINNKIEKLLLKNYGERIKTKKDICVLKYQSKASSIFSIGIVNDGNEIYRVILSFKEAKNIIFSEDINQIEKVVKPGKYELFTNIFYFDNNEDGGSDNIDFNVEYYPVN